jgi:hypothetical protein
MPRRRRWRFHPARQRHSEASCECQSVLVQTAVRAAGLTDAADGAGRSFTTANISTPAALAIGWFVQTMPLDAWAGVLKSGASASGWVDKRRASVGERRGMRSMRSSRHMGRRLRADVQRAAGLQRRCPTAFCALNRSGRWARGLFATTGNTRKAPVETAWTELTAAAAGAARAARSSMQHLESWSRKLCPASISIMADNHAHHHALSRYVRRLARRWLAIARGRPQQQPQRTAHRARGPAAAASKRCR